MISMLIQEETRLKNQKARSVHLLSRQEAAKDSKRKRGRSKKKSLHNLNGSFEAVPRRNTRMLSAT